MLDQHYFLITTDVFYRTRVEVAEIMRLHRRGSVFGPRVKAAGF